MMRQECNSNVFVFLRFIRGVVDSEDLPLSISREKPQDSQLLKRIKDVLTRKLIRFLDEQATSDPQKYKEFYIEFNYFLKEGLCQDYKYQDQLAKLLLFETSSEQEGMLTSLDEYIARSAPEQKEIYYLVAPSRAAALKSPYYETFKKHNKEVLFLFNAIDDFVMSNLKTYSGRTLTSAETSSVKLDDDASTSEDKSDDQNKLKEADATAMCEWLRTTLGSRVREVRVTNRLAESPAIVTDHEGGALRRMMKAVVSHRNIATEQTHI